MTSVNSEICQDIKAYRYDCGCLYYSCGSGTDITAGSEPAAPQINSCLFGDYFLVNGKIDFSCDQLETQADIVLSESIGVCSEVFDGGIENFMCLVNSGNECEFPASGTFKFTDGNGIIYVTQWESYSNRIDITWTTFDPRVPGEEPSGFMVGKQVYRHGVITTTRQILEYTDEGTTVIEEASEQRIDFFRTTFDCGDVVSEDPFRYHFDCAVSDILEIDEISGSSS